MISQVAFLIIGIIIGWFFGNLIDGIIFRVFKREDLRNFCAYGKGKKWFDDEHL